MPKNVELNPFWFKLKIVERSFKGDKPDTDYAYVSGHNIQDVITRNQLALGPGYSVYAKPVTYDQIIKELSSGT